MPTNPHDKNVLITPLKIFNYLSKNGERTKMLTIYPFQPQFSFSASLNENDRPFIKFKFSIVFLYKIPLIKLSPFV